MLTPDYLAHCADDVIKLYQQLDDDIIQDIVRRLVNTDFQMTQSAVWQAEKLQQSGVVYQDAIKRIAQITGKSETELAKLFEDGGMETLRYDDAVYRKAGLNPLPLKQSPAMLEMLRAGYKKCGSTLHNLTLTTANLSQTAYIQACDRAYMQVSSGAFDYNTAVRRAVEDLSKTGTYILYPSGHRDRIDVAVRRAVVTGVSQTCGQLQIARMDEMGCDLVETTAHMGARAEHEEWQGRVFSRSGKNGNYPDFESSTGYGTGAGLMGWNCRHNFYPFFEGISTRAYSDADLREFAEHTVTYNGTAYSDYEASQVQRKMERTIRDTKRTLAGVDAAARETTDEALKRGLLDDFAAHSVKLKQQEAALRDFIDQTQRAEERARVQVAGFGRSAAQKAVQANKKALQNGGIGGIIKAGDVNNMNVKIDSFTPCLVNRKTGEVFDTLYSKATKEELTGLKKKGWLFNWRGSDLKDATIYKLTLEANDEIQGLVALTDYTKDRAIYVNLAESAPHNKGKNKEYEGVGGHLFAIAANESTRKGYGGFLFMDAKNMELVEHYQNQLGAVRIGTPHPFRMLVDEDAAQKLLSVYTFKEGK